MCYICQEVKSGNINQAVYAMGISGVAVGAKMSWRNVVGRLKGNTSVDATDDDEAVPVDASLFDSDR